MFSWFQAILHNDFAALVSCIPPGNFLYTGCSLDPVHLKRNFRAFFSIYFIAVQTSNSLKHPVHRLLS